MTTAFAIFCADDGSLIFYNRDTVPTAGETFEDKIASNVYTGFDTAIYSTSSSVPWYNEKTNIISVSFTPEFATVKPISVAFWFFKATNMASFDGANLDTSEVTNMQRMFNDCRALTSLDLSSFDTSKVTDMGSMFSNCKTLTSLDLSSFDTSKVTDMGSMFSNCEALTSLDLSSFDTSKVTDMDYMFSNCKTLTSLDLSSFDTSKVTDMDYMFFNCKTLTTIYVLDTWTTNAVTSSANMFTGCTNLVGAISYNSSKIDVTYANYTTGYLTDKAVYMLIKDITLYRLADKIRILNDSKYDMTPTNMIEILSNIRDAREVSF